MVWAVHEIGEGEIVALVGIARTDGGAVTLAQEYARAEAVKLRLGDLDQITLERVDHGEQGFQIDLDHPRWEWHFSVRPQTVFEGA